MDDVQYIYIFWNTAIGRRMPLTQRII